MEMTERESCAPCPINMQMLLVVQYFSVQPPWLLLFWAILLSQTNCRMVYWLLFFLFFVLGVKLKYEFFRVPRDTVTHKSFPRSYYFPPPILLINIIFIIFFGVVGGGRLRRAATQQWTPVVAPHIIIQSFRIAPQRSSSNSETLPSAKGFFRDKRGQNG